MNFIYKFIEKNWGKILIFLFIIYSIFGEKINYWFSIIFLNIFGLLFMIILSLSGICYFFITIYELYKKTKDWFLEKNSKELKEYLSKGSTVLFSSPDANAKSLENNLNWEESEQVWDDKSDSFVNKKEHEKTKNNSSSVFLSLNTKERILDLLLHIVGLTILTVFTYKWCEVSISLILEMI